jgi:hypothetical protein
MNEDQRYEEQRIKEENSRTTVGELIQQLSLHPKDAEITFGCLMDGTFLVFYRVKHRGEKLVQIELNELRD